MSTPNDSFPEGKELVRQVRWRHGVGTSWRVVFLASTIFGIVALTALIYNIVNESFGLAAVQNQNEPAKLVLDVQEQMILGANNTITSEDDKVLVEAIASDPYAIGFFGYSYYSENADRLKTVSIGGVRASADSAQSGEYPLTRPLYLYTTTEVLQGNQAAAVYLNYTLTHVYEEVVSVGYFPSHPEELRRSRSAWSDGFGVDLSSGQWATIDPHGFTGSIDVAGSSTVLPLIQHMVNAIQAEGFAAEVNVEGIGTTAGMRAFCSELRTDVVTASRPIQPGEYEVCRSNGRIPLEMPIGTDALVVVVSSQNTFLVDATEAQPRQIFTSAGTWSDVNSQWPNAPIKRYIPGADSGTLDFFTETVLPIDLADLPKENLIDILVANISRGLGRRFEREQRFFDDQLVFEDPELFAEVCASDEPAAACTLPARSQQNVYELVLTEVVAPDVLVTWSLVDSIFNRDEIEQTVRRDHPNARLEFRSWISGRFLVNPQSSTPEFAGVRTAILGSLWVVAITALFSFPVGVMAAIYLEEYATDNRLNRLIQTNINNLAGVPSIVYGMLGLAIFVRALEPLTSGAALGLEESTASANGRTILSAGLTLGLLILPVIIIASQEAIRAVPNSLRQAGLALGATKWQTIWHHVLPSALPGVLTGAILAISRAIGETAPLVVVGASTFITVDPANPFSKFTTLPIQIYQWTFRPQAEFRNIAAAAIVVLLMLLITLNASAVLMRNRYSKKAQ